VTVGRKTFIATRTAKTLPDEDQETVDGAGPATVKVTGSVGIVTFTWDLVDQATGYWIYKFDDSGNASHYVPIQVTASPYVLNTEPSVDPSWEFGGVGDCRWRRDGHHEQQAH
jgi:hypothetical protein